LNQSERQKLRINEAIFGKAGKDACDSERRRRREKKTGRFLTSRQILSARYKRGCPRSNKNFSKGQPFFLINFEVILYFVFF